MTDNRTTERVDHPPRVRGAIDELMREKDAIDNRTTELLRKLLDEHDVEWRETINHANCIFTWWESPTFGTVYAMDNEDGETLFMDCLNNCDFTPEQAVAATLGRPTFNANLEQALSFMRIWISDDAHLGESELSAAFEKAEGLRKLDAIENAIAATLGNEREKALEELVRDLIPFVCADDGIEDIEARMRALELEIEVY